MTCWRSPSLSAPLLRFWMSSESGQQKAEQWNFKVLNSNWNKTVYGRVRGACNLDVLLQLHVICNACGTKFKVLWKIHIQHLKSTTRWHVPVIPILWKLRQAWEFGASLETPRWCIDETCPGVAWSGATLSAFKLVNNDSKLFASDSCLLPTIV